MDTLLLRFRPDGAVEWRLNDEYGLGSLDEAAAWAHGRSMTVLVPGEQVLLIRTAMPTRKVAEIERALPYAVEDWLIDPPESQHFAWLRGSDEVAAAVVTRDRMQTWAETLQRVGIRAQSMHPDTLAVPWQVGRWSLWLEGDRALLRHGRADGFACSRGVLVAMVSALYAEIPEDALPQGLDVWCWGGDLPGEWPEGLEVQQQTLAAFPLVGLQPDAAELNLLRGDFAIHEVLGHHLGPWKIAAVAAVIWLVSALALQITRHFVLAHEQAQLNSKIVQVFHQAMPDTQRIVDAKVQMQQALQALRGGSERGGALNLLAAAAPVLVHASGMQIRRIEYQDGELNVHLTAGEFGSFERLKKALQVQGLKVNLQSMSARKGVANGNVQIRGGRT